MKIGDRMKTYEGQESDRCFLPGLPVCVRLDGRAFHTFTKGLKRPFDEDFRSLMVAVTKELVKETNACVGYTQSDEISLVIWNDDPKAQTYFGGRIQKTTSLLASLASVTFNNLVPSHLPAKVGKIGLFDCRAWVVPNLEEAANSLLWREQDATKNSISSAAQAHFSHKSLLNLHSNELQEKLFSEAGINWNNYPPAFKRGSYVARRKVMKPFSKTELASLPPKHAARKNPDLLIERIEVIDLGLPPLKSIVNKVDILFRGMDPESCAQWKDGCEPE